MVELDPSRQKAPQTTCQEAQGPTGLLGLDINTEPLESKV